MKLVDVVKNSANICCFTVDNPYWYKAKFTISLRIERRLRFIEIVVEPKEYALAHWSRSIREQMCESRKHYTKEQGNKQETQSLHQLDVEDRKLYTVTIGTYQNLFVQ